VSDFQNKKLNFFSATNLVVANIIGAGIFTISGYTLGSVPSVFGLLFIWFVGGILALCGALVYGELTSIMPKSGGEYYYLSRIYHPILGFLSGFISLTAGFAAPVAAASLAFGKYLSAVIYGQSDDNLTKILAILIIISMSVVHSTSLSLGSKIQNVLTAIKVALLLFFVISGLLITPNPQNISILPQSGYVSIIFSSGFAVSLIYISFAYSGWNAAAYMSEEVDNPQKNVPRALFTGTIIVMALYLLINFVFVYSSSISDLQFKAEVGDVAARNIFGQQGGKIVSTMIALALTSSISAMIMAGPRVIQAMGKDFPIFAAFAKNNKNGIPSFAIIAQSAISILVVLSSELSNILNYIGFTLSIFTVLTVIGLMIYRFKHPHSQHIVRTPLYPIPPLLFLSLSLGMIIYNFIEKPNESLIGLATLGVGIIIYFLTGQNKVQFLFHKDN
jgi:APA family basic amino acid/polyamine antiporter